MLFGRQRKFAIAEETNMTTEKDDEGEPRTTPRRQRLHTEAAAHKGQLDALSIALGLAFEPASIDAADARELAKISVPYRIDAGSHILRHDHRSDALWLVEKGHVSVGLPDPSGNWRQTRAVSSGQWLDTASAWLKGTYIESAVASTAVLAHEFPVDELGVLLGRRPTLARALLTAMAARVRRATSTGHDLAVRDARGRVSSWLLDNASAAVPPRVTMRQHKRTLAGELGISAETLSRALAKLRKDGVIAVSAYNIELLGVDTLKQLAGR